MKQDLTSRTDIELFVDTFYAKVVRNTLIGPIFTDVASVEWDHHLPVMYSFWETLLLNGRSYAGNPMASHAALNKTFPLRQHHFDEWVRILRETVDELFAGPVAEQAKARGTHIAQVMHHIMRESELKESRERL